MQSEDRNFSYWLNYFEKNKPSLAEFFVAIDKKDTYFLNNEMPLDYNDELYEKVYPAGFIEGDFIKASLDNDDTWYYQTRIALYLFKGLNLDLLRKRISEESFSATVGECLINGRYEEFGIEFYQIMTVLFKNKIVSMDNLMDWGFLYGARLGETYGEDYNSNSILNNKRLSNAQEIESLRLSGIAEPDRILSIGNTGNDWLDDNDE